MVFVFVWGAWGIDGGWMSLPTRLQRCCDPLSLVMTRNCVFNLLMFMTRSARGKILTIIDGPSHQLIYQNIIVAWFYLSLDSIYLLNTYRSSAKCFPDELRRWLSEDGEHLMSIFGVSANFFNYSWIIIMHQIFSWDKLFPDKLCVYVFVICWP